MYANLTFEGVTLAEENKAVIVVFVKRIIKLTHFLPIYVIDIAIIFCSITLERTTALWEFQSVCVCAHAEIVLFSFFNVLLQTESDT